MMKAPTIRLLVLLALPLLGAMLFYGCAIRMPGKSFRGPLPELDEGQRQLEAELTRHVTVLAEEIGPRTIVLKRNMAAAVTYLEEQLSAAGYMPERHTFTVGAIEAHNIVAELPGSSHPDEIVIVGGHYDTCGNIPGANDNASGSAATLALARHFASVAPPGRTLRFVLFANEEPPFFRSDDMGSRQYARRCADRNENITAMLSLETMAYYSDQPGSQAYPVGALKGLYPDTGNFIGFIGNTRSRKLVRRAVKIFREHASFPSEGAALPGNLPGVGWSDHESFWLEDIPAIMVTDTAPFRYPHYHLPSDTPDRCNFSRLARVVDGLIPVIEDLTLARDP